MVEYFQIFLERDFWVMIPELFLVFAVVFLTVLGVFFSKAVMSVEKRVIEVVLDLGILSLFWLMLLYYNQFGLDCYALNFQVKKDSISLFFSMLLMVGTLCSLVIAKSYIKNDTVNDFEYVVLVLLALLGLLTIVSCNDLLLIYLGIELQSLCLYVLATIKRHSRFSTEAGLKYFVLGAFSSGILLFGMSLFYGFTGITNLTDIEYFFLQGEMTPGIALGSLFIFIGLLFKVGAAPFHVWVPDVYAGIPTFITSFFAIVPKMAIFGLLIKMLFIAEVGNFDLFLYSGILSLFIGSFGAIYQVTIKRLIAYSAIGHTGFILLGLYSGGIEGVVAVCLYVLIYMVMVINFFSILLAIRKESDSRGIRMLGTFNEVYRSNKLLGISLCLLLFSMAGIPPLSGFYSKLYIFFAMIKEEHFIASILVVCLSVIGSVYYLRLIRTMFFNTSRQWGFYKPVSKGTSLVIVYSGLFTLLFFVYSLPILIALHEIVLSFYF